MTAYQGSLLSGIFVYLLLFHSDKQGGASRHTAPKFSYSIFLSTALILTHYLLNLGYFANPSYSIHLAILDSRVLHVYFDHFFTLNLMHKFTEMSFWQRKKKILACLLQNIYQCKMDIKRAKQCKINLPYYPRALLLML